MKKMYLAVCLLLAMALAAAVPCTAQARGIRMPRVISVVYDDSGSMDTLDGSMGKAAYANYAMKAFIALLDTEDILYVTFMSEPYKAHRLDLLKGADAVIAELDLLHAGGGMTPFETVTTAMDTLRSQPAPSEATMYWLVIFTDGQFSSDNSLVAPNIDDALSRFLKNAMPNGTLPQACYVAIGGDALRPAKAMDSLTVYPETGFIENSENILDVMRTMADKISGRARLDAGRIAESGATVRFTTDLPCFSIAVLQQKDKAPWIQMTGAGGVALDGSKVAISAAGALGEGLVGWAGKFTGGAGDVLPAGTYELTFPAPPSDYVIMTEPALVLDLTVTAADGGTDDLSLVNAGKADIRGVLHLWNDPAPVDPALLPAGTTYSLIVKREGQTVAETGGADMHLTDVGISQADTAVLGSAELPGVGTVMASRTIHIPEYTLDLTREDSGRFTLRELVNNTKGIIAAILRDGVPVSKEDAEKMGIDAACLLPVSVTRLDTGGFLLAPFLEKLGPLSSYGDMAATLTITGAAGKTKSTTVSWQVQKPKILVEGEFLGTDTVARTAIWKGPVLGMHDVISIEPEKGLAQTQVIASFQILLDGRQLTSLELDAWGQVSVSLAGDAREHYLCDIWINPDGTILAMPIAPPQDMLSGPWLRWLDSWRLWPADGIIQCALGNEASAGLPFHIVLEPWYVILLNMALPVLLLALLLGYLFKRRFARGAAVRFVNVSKAGDSLTSGGENWREERLGRLNGWSFVPYARARSKAGGLTFYAGRKGFVLIRQEALLKESSLIAQRFCTFRGGFSMLKNSEDRRPIHAPEGEQKAGRFSVLAKNDVLILTGDNRSGRAYMYQ